MAGESERKTANVRPLWNGEFWEDEHGRPVRLDDYFDLPAEPAPYTCKDCGHEAAHPVARCIEMGGDREHVLSWSGNYNVEPKGCDIRDNVLADYGGGIFIRSQTVPKTSLAQLNGESVLLEWGPVSGAKAYEFVHYPTPKWYQALFRKLKQYAHGR